MSTEASTITLKLKYCKQNENKKTACLKLAHKSNIAFFIHKLDVFLKTKWQILISLSVISGNTPKLRRMAELVLYILWKIKTY